MANPIAGSYRQNRRGSYGSKTGSEIRLGFQLSREWAQIRSSAASRLDQSLRVRVPGRKARAGCEAQTSCRSDLNKGVTTEVMANGDPRTWLVIVASALVDVIPSALGRSCNRRAGRDVRNCHVEPARRNSALLWT